MNQDQELSITIKYNLGKWSIHSLKYIYRELSERIL
jgi:hypothetical protein